MSRLHVQSGIAIRCLVLGLVLSGFMAAMLVAQPTPPASEPGESPTTQPVKAPAAAEQPKDVQPPAGKSATDNAGTDVPEAGKSDGDPKPPRQPSPAEILRELTRTGGANKGVVLPDNPNRRRASKPAPEALPSNAISPANPRLLPDGYRLVDRPGRLTQHDNYWMFSFESRGRGTPEMPIRLLPNRLLEDMEEFSAGGTKDIVFIVSGEVTEYRGVNYLLIQKLLTRPSVGNLQ